VAAIGVVAIAMLSFVCSIVFVRVESSYSARADGRALSTPFRACMRSAVVAFNTIADHACSKIVPFRHWSDTDVAAEPEAPFCSIVCGRILKTPPFRVVRRVGESVRRQIHQIDSKFRVLFSPNFTGAKFHRRCTEK
jgi:hypothetical protein